MYPESDPAKVIITTRNEGISFSMMKYDKMSEKFKELYINGSLQISVLLDMIELKGLDNFLKKKANRQSNVYIRCKYRTAVNELRQTR